MANLDHVRRALAARLETLAHSPALPIAWPEAGQTFSATSGPYLQVDLFFNRPRWEGLSEGVLDQGLMQVTVVWPKNQGLHGALGAAEAIRAHFAPPRVLRHGGTGVKISGQPWTASPLSEPSEVRVPVTIPWTA